MRVLAALIALGCQGESVSSTTPPSDAGADTTSATCDTIANNLVDNPSFEDGVANWGSLVESVSGGADHCSKWARVVTNMPWQSASHRVEVAGKKGDVFDFGASVQILDNESDVDVFLQSPTAEDNAHVVKTGAKNTWVRASGSLTLTADVTNLTIGVGANSSNLRKYGMDRLWIVKR